MKWYGIDLDNPDPRHFDLGETAWALAGIRRYQGRGVSVAWHSLEVADLVPFEAKPWALMHDCHEAFLGDPHGLLARRLPAYKEAADKIDRAYLRAIGMPYPSAEILAMVHEADVGIRVSEVEELRKIRCWGYPPEPNPRVVAHKWLSSVEKVLTPLR